MSTCRPAKWGSDGMFGRKELTRLPNAYIPSNDVLFLDWFTNFVDYLTENHERLDVKEEELTALQGLLTAYEAGLTAYHELRDQARAAGSNKREKRSAAESYVRPVVTRIQAWSGTTDDDRDRMRIPVHARQTSQSVDVFADRPVPIIDINNRLIHVIRARNIVGEIVSNARPAWAIGCEIWRTIGDAPGQTPEYVDMIRSGRFVIEYPPTEGGKQVHYIMRWVGAKGEKGPWSEPESVTIAA